VLAIRKRQLRCWAALVGSGLILAASASPAAASVTLGQLAASPQTTCNGVFDTTQPTVTSGNTYVVPGAGTITSWSHNAVTGPDQTLTLKIFRKVADPARYQIVGHDGPRPLAGGLLNTFPASVPVKPGDVLGVSGTSLVDTACTFDAPGDSVLTINANLADGESADFFSASDNRVNVSAVFVYSNAFSFGKARRNKKKGTATLAFNLPNPGGLSGSGQGAQVASAGAVMSKAVPAGTATLVVKAKGKKKRKLNEKGKVKLNLAVTYTPTNGDPKTQSMTVKLKKNL
jgi:hypothetical protein